MATRFTMHFQAASACLFLKVLSSVNYRAAYCLRRLPEPHTCNLMGRVDLLSTLQQRRRPPLAKCRPTCVCCIQAQAGSAGVSQLHDIIPFRHLTRSTMTSHYVELICAGVNVDQISSTWFENCPVCSRVRLQSWVFFFLLAIPYRVFTCNGRCFEGHCVLKFNTIQY